MEPSNLVKKRYLSPTQLALWQQNPESYYLKYVAIDKPPRIKQTEAMSVGSAFDAYVKSYLYRALFGVGGKLINELSFETLFEKQVEPHNKDWARRAGQHCFHVYEKSGALRDLLAMLLKSKVEPQFETTERSSGVKIKEGVVTAKPEGDAGCPELMGKPDLYFNIMDTKVVLDWKVNGYCSASGKSPTQGYTDVFEYSGNRKGSHTSAVAFREERLGGLLVNSVPSIEKHEKDWGRQLTTYSWLVGAEVGSDILVLVDQLCCDTNKLINDNPGIRVARHCCPISQQYQVDTYNAYQILWSRIHSSHFFRERSFEESKARCETLNTQAQAYRGETEQDKWFLEIMGRG